MNYAISLAALAMALLLRLAVEPWLGGTLPFVTVFGAIAVAVWFGGYGPGILAAGIGWCACAYLFAQPHPFVGLIAYVLTSAILIAIGDAARRAQARTRDQREVLRITLRSIGDGVITTDVAGRVTYLNEVAEALTGWSNADACGQPLPTVFPIFDESTRRPVESPVVRALREGVVVGLANHTILEQRGGGEIPIDDSAAPIRDDHGRVTGCVLVFRDAGAHRRIERERTQQLLTARTLAAIVESSDDAIVGKSLDGVIQSWNRGAERIFGHTAEQAIGRHISLVIPPDRIAEEDRIIASLKAGERIDHFETERVRRDGRRIRVSLTISPIRDDAGNVVGASKIVRDVTEQRRAAERERELLGEAAEANAKFRAFFDQGALFSGIMDVDGTLREANRLSLEGCGFTAEQAVGKPFWEGPWWSPSPALVARIRAACTEAAAGRPFRAEMPYFVADGSERVVDVSIQPIRDESGRVRFLAPMGNDVTERKRVEAELARLASDLSDADQRKNEFLATLAHELRNPLAPISNMLEVMKRAEGDVATLARARDTMERQLGQMVRLVDDLLDLNRITHNRLELRAAPVALATILEHAVEASRPLIDAAGHTLRITLPATPVQLHADVARLTQVFANLVNNACKYTPPGGTIAITAARDGDEVVVSVKDDGVGIPPAELDRIFDMFMQVDGSAERSQGGLGLGLTLVKQLVEMHGGRVTARSEGEGRGSEFVVRLPVLLEPHAVATPATAAAEASRTRRIVVVDDNEDSAVSLAMLLDIHGNETHTAHDGVEAIATVERHRPDVVLLDIGLPKLNGHEVCRRIREEPWGRDVAIIALTGWGQDEDRRRSEEAGFDGHLVKPIDYEALVQLLDGLDERSARS